MKENKREIRSMAGGQFQPRLREATGENESGRIIEGVGCLWIIGKITVK